MPLMVFFFSVQLESKVRLTEDEKKWLDQILRAGDHLLDLIDEVLNLSHIESGKLKITIEPINIFAIKNEVIGNVTGMSKERNIKIIDQIENNQKCVVLADKTRLRQVLLNLLTNGIKYNREGGSITLSIEKTETRNLKISVSDTGKGIPEDQQPYIFNAFERLGAERSEVDGTGIGLTITKNLVELMNGKISLESVIDKGSCFSITLPQPQEKSPEHLYKNVLKEAKHVSLNKENHNNRETLILYIEDNVVNIELVKHLLKNRKNTKFIYAEDATSGIALATSNQPNIILLDLHLPDMDGMDVFRELQLKKCTSEIPVIALSADAMVEEIDMALEAGFKAYITKPINFHTFTKTLEELLA